MKLLLVALSVVALQVAVGALSLRAHDSFGIVADPEAADVPVDEALGWSGALTAPQRMGIPIAGPF